MLSPYRLLQMREGAARVKVEEVVVMKSALSSHSDKLDGGRLVRPDCPQCGDRLFASSVSVHVNENDIRHWWACDNCGHEFMTTVRVRKLARRRTLS
jgi:transcription elongation factor Elf1